MVSFVLVVALLADAVQLAQGIPRGVAFLSMSERMQPDVVAHTLLQVEREWKAQAALYADCSASSASAGSAACKQSVDSFGKSCSTVVSALLRGNDGNQHAVKEYLSDVCAQPSLVGWVKQRCDDLAVAIDHSMTPDSRLNRESASARSPSVCSYIWAKIAGDEAAAAARLEQKAKKIEDQRSMSAAAVAQMKRQQAEAERVFKAAQTHKATQTEAARQQAAAVRAFEAAKARKAAQTETVQQEAFKAAKKRKATRVELGRRLAAETSKTKVAAKAGAVESVAKNAVARTVNASAVNATAVETVSATNATDAKLHDATKQIKTVNVVNNTIPSNGKEVANVKTAHLHPAAQINNERESPLASFLQVPNTIISKALDESEDQSEEQTNEQDDTEGDSSEPTIDEVSPDSEAGESEDFLQMAAAPDGDDFDETEGSSSDEMGEESITNGNASEGSAADTSSDDEVDERMSLLETSNFIEEEGSFDAVESDSEQDFDEVEGAETEEAVMEDSDV